jgi:hypothetical protein
MAKWFSSPVDSTVVMVILEQVRFSECAMLSSITNVSRRMFYVIRTNSVKFGRDVPWTTSYYD